jgi:dienelactone hydrolase
MPIVSQEVRYRDGNTELTGCLLSDEGRHNRRPGVLVVHGGAGLDNHAKNRARAFAEQGYVAFACDMYGDGVAEGGRARIMPLIMQLCADPTRLCQRAGAAIEVLRAHPQVDGRSAEVG